MDCALTGGERIKIEGSSCKSKVCRAHLNSCKILGARLQLNSVQFGIFGCPFHSQNTPRYHRTLQHFFCWASSLPVHRTSPLFLSKKMSPMSHSLVSTSIPGSPFLTGDSSGPSHFFFKKSLLLSTLFCLPSYRFLLKISPFWKCVILVGSGYHFIFSCQWVRWVTILLFWMSVGSVTLCW